MKAGRVLVAVVVVAAAIGGAGGAASAAETDPGQEESELLNADSITVTVDLREDGTAEWAIQYKYRLDSTNRTRGFERLRGTIGDGDDAYADDVRSDVQQTVDLAENETGRTMSVENVSVDAHRQTIPQDFGVVVHRFTWEGFANAEGSELRAGDAIRGFWLRPRTELRFEWPASYGPAAIEPGPDETDSDGVTWENPDFGVDEPSVVVERESTSGWIELAVPGLLVVGAVAALLLVRYRDVVRSLPDASVPTPGFTTDAGGTPATQTNPSGAIDSATRGRSGVASSATDSAQRRTAGTASTNDDATTALDGGRDRPDTGEAGEEPSAAATSAPATAESTANSDGVGERSDDAERSDAATQSVSDDGVEAASADRTGAASADRTGAASADSAEAASDGSTDRDPSDTATPLSNEEQLRRVLERNDGRIKQQAIADACDWSDSKTSRVVRSLESDGVVDVFRIGRENVVSNTEDDLEDV